ncbi:MAG TPA: FAD-dependent oxidoreductase [Leptolinea sp.]
MNATLNNNTFTVAIVGAGPAGLFAARELAASGVHVLIFNRDIKPGGLAEYGIYPDKLKMKEGLRHQFRQILQNPNIKYFGNIQIGEGADISLPELASTGVHAILIAVGAQATKWLGIPGEDLIGVYHAKDVVYHYNRLPPFSQNNIQIGKRVALIGVGNVMMDITHWLTHEKAVDDITVLARRGPDETKFDLSQFEYVASYLDLADLENEFVRVAPFMQRLGQDPEITKQRLLSVLEKAEPRRTNAQLRLRFLKSPVKILGNNLGRVNSLVLEENTLDLQDSTVVSHGLGIFNSLDVDTIIFAIGDRVDRNIGLPVIANEFVKAPEPRFPVHDESYEIFDPQTGKIAENLFVAGWARKASSGLVGLARRDGVNGAQTIGDYLKTRRSASPVSYEKLNTLLGTLNHPVVQKEDLLKLEEIERLEAAALKLDDFKFNSNEEMLAVLGLFSEVKSY